jgi:hypothetical protein
VEAGDGARSGGGERQAEYEELRPLIDISDDVENSTEPGDSRNLSKAREAAFVRRRQEAQQPAALVEGACSRAAAASQASAARAVHSGNIGAVGAHFLCCWPDSDAEAQPPDIRYSGDAALFA